MKQRHASIQFEQLILIGIVALALIARFRYLVYIEHNIDQAYPIWQAMETLANGIFPTIGQGTSVLFANPPMTGYLYLPIVALTGSPLGVEIFVIALNSLAVWMGYRVACYLIDRRWALLVALLIAVNPWMIEYSRTTWVQSLLPFFATALLWQLVPVFLGQTKRPARRILIGLILLGIVANTYLLAFLWSVPVALLLVIFRRRVAWRATLLGVALCGLMTLPYALTLLSDMDAVVQQLSDFRSGESQFHIEALGHAVRLASGARYDHQRGLDAPIVDVHLRQPLSEFAHLVLLFCMMVGLAGVLWRMYRKLDGSEASIIILIWFFVPIIAMSYTSNPVHPFYQLLGVPMGAVLAVLGMKRLYGEGASPRVARLGGVAMTGFCVLMLVNSARFGQETAHLPGAHQLGALPLGTGVQLGQMLALPEGGVVFADMPQWILNSFVGRVFPLIRDHRAPAFERYPANGGIYLTMGDDAPHHVKAYDNLPLGDGTQIHIYYLQTGQEALTSAQVRYDIATTQGLRWMGYSLHHGVDSGYLRLVWRVDAIAPEVPELTFATFVHLYNANDERVGILSGNALEGWQWRVGDVYVDEITFRLPNEGAPFRLRIGQYDGVRGVNLVFVLHDQMYTEMDIFITPP